MSTPAELASTISEQTVFPDIAFRINDMLGDENSSTADIAALIAPDPAMSAALMKLANSATYSIGGDVACVDRAVTLVGLRQVRDLAFGVCLLGIFNGLRNDIVTVQDFTRHSLHCASAAQVVGKKTAVAGAETLFVAGLLHDIGQLVMFRQRPAESMTVIDVARTESAGLDMPGAERQVFGFDHADVGAELAGQWLLPEAIVHCIRFHHDPLSAPENVDLVAVIHLANSIGHLAEIGSRNWSKAPALAEDAIGLLGLDRRILMELVTETRDAVADLQGVLKQ